MDRVLVYGLKDPVGGVEQVAMEYVRHITAAFDISFDFVCFAEDFSLQSEIEGLGCRVIYMPSRKKDFFGYKRAMESVFRQNRYIAVWGNYSGLTNIDLLVLAKKYGVPVRIAHSHVARLYWDSRIMKYVVHILHRYNKFRLKGYANRFWACSRMAGEFMFPPSVHGQISVVKNAVDLKRFYPDAAAGEQMRCQLGIDKKSLVVGHVARMCEAKNQMFLLQIMSDILKKVPDAKLLFVGDGEKRAEIEAETDRLGIRESVIFTGERQDVPQLLRAMNVFVLPSFSEGLALCAVEAQACGLAAVVSDRVPDEVNVTGMVTFISLENSAEYWADIIIKHACMEPNETHQKIIDSGYEILSETKKIYRAFKDEMVL